MNRLLVSFLVLCLLSSACFAGFGRGGSSGGRSFSSGSSSVRSYSSEPRSYAYARPSYVTPTHTVVHHTTTTPSSAGGGGFMSGFLGGAAGAAVGNALTSNHGTAAVQPVVVQGQPVVASAATPTNSVMPVDNSVQYIQPAVAHEPSFMMTMLMVLFGLIVFFGVYHFVTRK